MLPLPLFHVYASVGAQSLAFLNRSPLGLVANPRNIDSVVDAIDQLKPAFFSGVPALFVALLNHSRIKSHQVSLASIKLSFSGAAALMAETKRRFEELTGGRIVEGYSLSEAMMACVVNPVGQPGKLGSVGLPLPDVQVRIVDLETGQTQMSNGQEGELILRAPQLMAGYFENPKETALMVREYEGQQWLYTGDIAVMDDDGYITIVDRKKDLIKAANGYQVWPRDIEEVVSSHPAVNEVCVVGVPHPNQQGDVIKAWVVLKAGMTASVSDLRVWCKKSLAPYKVPRDIEFCSAIPKTHLNKPDRKALRKQSMQ